MEERSSLQSTKHTSRVVYDSNTNSLFKLSSFSSLDGSTEIFISVDSKKGDDFQAALSQVELSYIEVLERHNLPADSCVFCRIFLSDIENQKTILSNARFFRSLGNAAVSVIGEPCIRGGPICLLAYHIHSIVKPIFKKTTEYLDDEWRRDVLISGTHYSMLWNTNYSVQKPFDAHTQTDSVFQALGDIVRDNGMTFFGNAIRSWVFVRDIDNNYSDMVKARKKIFSRANLTEKTRYLASTGIGGESRNIDSLVSVDMLSFFNLIPEQIVPMKVLDNMPPTINYGVTFERGLRITFGDRAHLYISGTASINKDGEVVHHGDPMKQTLQALDNVNALLKSQGATLEDLTYLIVYIRDFASTQRVCDTIHRLIPKGLPLIMVKSCVCRPSWLIEVEGVAIVPTVYPFPPFL